MDVYVLDVDNIPLLCGEDTMKEWKVIIDMGQNTVQINVNKPLTFDCQTVSSGHKVLELHNSGQWSTNDTVYFMSQENDITTFKSIKRIHDVTNHKSEDQLLFAFRNANKLDDSVRKTIKRVAEGCRVCQRI